jgi:hypothetical protein
MTMTFARRMVDVCGEEPGTPALLQKAALPKGPGPRGSGLYFLVLEPALCNSKTLRVMRKNLLPPGERLHGKSFILQ